MQTIASTLVVQKSGYTNSIVMYINRSQMHSRICNIISFNADFLSMKGLKSICTIRDCWECKIYMEVVRTKNTTHAF